MTPEMREMTELKVTPGMIAAGADILWNGTSLDVGRSECETLAERIFLAMQAKERAEIDGIYARFAKTYADIKDADLGDQE